MAKLGNVITRGWPTDNAHLDRSLQPCWSYRDELSRHNGIIYKGLQASIPPSMHTQLLHSIHSNNLGAESNIRRAKEVLFWSGMRSDLHDMCQACTACAKYGQYAKHESMKSLPLPTLPWQLVSQDRFSLHGKNYLVTVFHYSDWIETDKLENTLLSTVMNATRSHFARFGVPDVCHTDNGPQFMSKEYQDYARDYGFKHITSSPYHPQRNGRAEAAVKVCKAQLRKSDDYDKKMLFYRNTPPTGHTYSPAQRMFCHRTRTSQRYCDSRGTISRLRHSAQGASTQENREQELV